MLPILLKLLIPQMHPALLKLPAPLKRKLALYKSVAMTKMARHVLLRLLLEPASNMREGNGKNFRPIHRIYEQNNPIGGLMRI